MTTFRPTFASLALVIGAWAVIHVNTSEESRRGNLDYCLALIDGYEREAMQARTCNTIHQRTSEEIRRECDYYRRWTYTTFGFPNPGDDQDKKVSEEENLQNLRQTTDNRQSLLAQGGTD